MRYEIMYLNKSFSTTFLDPYYMLCKDKGSNVIIKFGHVAPKVFKKVSYDDSRNKERLINIFRSMKESDKFTCSVKEIVEEAYTTLLGLRIISNEEK